MRRSAGLETLDTISTSPMMGCRACESLHFLPVGASRPPTPAHDGMPRVTANAVTLGSRSVRFGIDNRDGEGMPSRGSSGPCSESIPVPGAYRSVLSIAPASDRAGHVLPDENQVHRSDS